MGGLGAGRDLHHVNPILLPTPPPDSDLIGPTMTTKCKDDPASHEIVDACIDCGALSVEARPPLRGLVDAYYDPSRDAIVRTPSPRTHAGWSHVAARYGRLTLGDEPIRLPNFDQPVRNKRR
jgi:hypothetical protein